MSTPSPTRTARNIGIGFVIGIVAWLAVWGLLTLVGVSGSTAGVVAFVVVMAGSIGVGFASGRAGRAG